MLVGARYDVVVLGAGPVGCVAAIAQAAKGKRVALLEANPKGASRLAGEWLHPTALDVLDRLGIAPPRSLAAQPRGQGFAIFPDDRAAPILLPYADGTQGGTCEHRLLVEHLRAAAVAQSGIDYQPFTRALAVEADAVTVRRLDRDDARLARLRAPLIVGADGRRSTLRRALGLADSGFRSSMMAGLVLQGVELPFEGYGHVFLSAAGPVLAYRLDARDVRLIIDLPEAQRAPRDRTAYLWEVHAPALPEPLRAAFRRALGQGPVDLATNTVSPRTCYGAGGHALVGDAAGHYNPLTALGMTLGFCDAIELAEAQSVEAFGRRRLRECRASEVIAIGIYEAFSRHDLAARAVRHRIFALWRKSPAERARTMRYLAGQEQRVGPFAVSFARVMLGGIGLTLREGRRSGDWTEAADAIRRSFAHGRAWCSTALLHRPLVSAPEPGTACATTPPMMSEDADPAPAFSALDRGTAHLVRLQQPDGGWEGEMVWCPMLAAQYVMTLHVLGRPIEGSRRRRILLHFERTRDPPGLWGLHEHSEPYLFVTALVYVAARLLGTAPDDPLLRPAAAFFRAEGGVAAIPSWGKFWLAMLGLYDWRGVNPVLPEVWALPVSLPLHPDKLYCHTRMIHLAMSVIYGTRFQLAPTPLTHALRAELYPDGYDPAKLAKSRMRLRSGDLYRAPSAALRSLYALSVLVERCHAKGVRRRLLDRLREKIRWEMRSTDHTCLSPVNGLLSMIALWIENPDDPDLLRALERFEGWIWQDDVDGLRVTGARSLSWDTAFALQALAAAGGRQQALGRGSAFLATQQIRESFPGHAEAFRIDPKGGWCFAGIWHGWPVSDCTAEAVSGILASSERPLVAEAAADAARFILRCQNPDGGFGSYEPRRTRLDLERLNPAEMFGDSMTEASYTECTASAIAALAELEHANPELGGLGIRRAVTRAARRLEIRQNADGSWPAAWGVHFIYGTLFGIIGLRAGGHPAAHPAIRRAQAWLLARQRSDGGWGEHHRSSFENRYIENPDSQVIQTAWAMLGLLRSECPMWPALDRGAAFLASRQQADGAWPKEAMAGVFFHTALLHYELYRSYFPVWALGLYRRRRMARPQATGGKGGIDTDQIRSQPVSKMIETTGVHAAT